MYYVPSMQDYAFIMYLLYTKDYSRHCDYRNKKTNQSLPSRSFLSIWRDNMLTNKLNIDKTPKNEGLIDLKSPRERP